MEITLKNLQKKIPLPRSRIFRLIGDVYRLNIPENRQLIGRRHQLISIVFVGTKRMRAINNKYLKHDYVTDVLTFDLGGGTAEIIVCPRVACINAKAHRTSTSHEIILYVVHGILHLAGYDDHSEKDIRQMRRMENELLKEL